MSESWLPQVQCFFGRVTSVTAELYARLRFVDATSPWHVRSVSVAGPRSRYARTLETSVELMQNAADETLWQATLEDPCFWTPRQPYLYRLRITLVGGGGAIGTMVCPLGVRVLMVREGRLEEAGKNWTLRAIRGDADDTAMLPACHASGTGLIVAHPSDEFCEMATDEGVLLVTDLSFLDRSNCEAELRRVARWPAVGMAILPESAEVDASLRQETSHVVRAQSWPALGKAAIADWTQALIVPREAVDNLENASVAGRAILVSTSSATIIPVTSMAATADPATQVALERQACDSLQAELAGRGSFAGYVVG